MKKCVVIINPKSGKGFHKKNIEKLKQILNDYKYEARIIFTEYRCHATSIIKELEDTIDLVISAGGDGTFSEVMNGNLERDHPLILSHLPVGTTNDLGHMYGFGNDLFSNLKLILEGSVKELDVGLINNHAFTYVASYGKFMDIPYKTPQELKKRLGYFAYMLEVLKGIFHHIPMYEMEFLLDNKEKKTGKYTFIILSNANRFAGIDNVYDDVKLDDSKFEVILCSLNRKRDILKAIYTLKTSHISKVSGIEIYKVSQMNIKFKEKTKPWCVDGEEFKEGKQEYQIQLRKHVKMQLPSKNIEKLFI